DRFVKLVSCKECFSPRECNDRRERIEFMGAVGLLKPLLHAADGGKKLGEPLMSGGVTGIESKGLPEFSLDPRKIPIVANLVGSQNRVGAGDRGIKFQRFACRSI